MEWTDDPERITYFAATHTRGKKQAFGIRAKDRTKHMYVIGKTGMGKSTMLENLAIQDIQNGEGMCFIDPHGSTAEKLLDFIPEDRIKDVLYFAPFDLEFPVGFNLLEDVGYDRRHLVISGLMGVFERLWADAWSARMSYILQNTLFALIEYPDATLLDVNMMLTNKAFREKVVQNISDPVVRQFWDGEFASYSDRYTQEATPAIQNKIGQLTNNPVIRNILGQPDSTFDVREMMDERKILIMNLSKGRIGEANTALLGAMFVVKIYLSALTRAAEPSARQNQLPPFYFYVDEFQSVMNRAFENILSESRKYRLALTLANQYVAQMEDEVRDAVFGNIGTFISFRIGPEDAEFVKTTFDPAFEEEDLQNLGLGEIYLRLMIDGVGSQPFSAKGLPPIEEPSISFKEEVIEYSRQKYARDRSVIEKKVNERILSALADEKEAHKRRSSAGQNSGAGASKRPSAQGGGARSAPPRQNKPIITSATPPPLPKNEPPKQQKSPLEVMREKQKEEQRKSNETQAQKPKPDQKKSENKERSALKDAILTATKDVTPPPTQKKPQPAQPPQKTKSNTGPQPMRKSDVSPEDLKRILNGDD